MTPTGNQWLHSQHVAADHRSGPFWVRSHRGYVSHEVRLHEAFVPTYLKRAPGSSPMKIYHGMPSYFLMLLGITFHILSMVTVWYTMVYLFENTKVIYHGFSFSQVNQLGIWHVQLNPKNAASRSNLRSRIAQYFQHVGLNKLTGLRPQLIFHIRTL